MARSNTEELQKLTRLFQNETGILEFTPAQVADWLKRRGYRMPVPPTPEEILARSLSKAMSAERRNSESGVDYRGTLSYKRRVDGQWEFFWFDADGPAATVDRMRRSGRMRRDHALDTCVQVGASERHWNTRHPGEEQLQTNFDLNDEVTWRLNGMDLDDDIAQAG